MKAERVMVKIWNTLKTIAAEVHTIYLAVARIERKLSKEKSNGKTEEG